MQMDQYPIYGGEDARTNFIQASIRACYVQAHLLAQHARIKLSEKQVEEYVGKRRELNPDKPGLSDQALLATILTVEQLVPFYLFYIFLGETEVTV